jgi:Skp family chaperone for outer membrane proteins
MNKWLVIIAAVVFLLPAFAAKAQNVDKQTPDKQSHVLIVDMKRTLDESKAAINVQKKIEAQRSSFQDEISLQEKLIREGEQELQTMRGKLNADQYAEKENQLRKKFRDVEKYVQERRQALEKATTAAMGKVRTTLLMIIKDIAKKRGVQAVLIKQQVLWAEDNLEITDDVLTRLNKELPDITVDIVPVPFKKEVP